MRCAEHPVTAWRAVWDGVPPDKQCTASTLWSYITSHRLPVEIKYGNWDDWGSVGRFVSICTTPGNMQMLVLRELPIESLSVRVQLSSYLKHAQFGWSFGPNLNDAYCFFQLEHEIESNRATAVLFTSCRGVWDTIAKKEFSLSSPTTANSWYTVGMKWLMDGNLQLFTDGRPLMIVQCKPLAIALTFTPREKGARLYFDELMVDGKLLLPPLEPTLAISTASFTSSSSSSSSSSTSVSSPYFNGITASGTVASTKPVSAFTPSSSSATSTNDLNGDIKSIRVPFADAPAGTTRPLQLSAQFHSTSSAPPPAIRTVTSGNSGVITDIYESVHYIVSIARTPQPAPALTAAAVASGAPVLVCRWSPEVVGEWLESLYSELHKFFGAEPDQHITKGRKLHAYVYANRESYLAKRHSLDSKYVDCGEAGAYHHESQSVLMYVTVGVSEFALRRLLFHETVHQFHFLAKTRNLRLQRASWYVMGIADFFAYHSYDDHDLGFPGILKAPHPAL